jgi:hypothetical protein
VGRKNVEGKGCGGRAERRKEEGRWSTKVVESEAS